MPPFLEIHELVKRFGELTVLDGISLEVAEGEILALLGPSGSGKTTLLRLLAGFETADGGTVRAGGEDITHRSPAQRGFGMVFQHYALFPHLTVAENIAFGLRSVPRSRRMSRDETAARVAAMLDLVDLAGFGERKIGELSGGQQQRVALGRALAPDPRLLLLDEPLSNLDPALRERTRRELRQAIAEVGITTVLVTHEQDEAFDLGDRVAVLSTGRLQQVGTPEELYLEPANRFVATFVGRSSALPGTVVAAGDAGLTVLLAANGEAPWEGLAPGEGGLEAGASVEVLARPESLALAPAADPGEPAALVGRVVDRRYGGPSTLYRVALPGVGEGAGEGAGEGTGEGARGALEVEVLASARAAAEGDRVRVVLRSPGDGAPRPVVFRRPEPAR